MLNPIPFPFAATPIILSVALLLLLLRVLRVILLLLLGVKLLIFLIFVLRAICVALWVVRIILAVPRGFRRMLLLFHGVQGSSAGSCSSKDGFHCGVLKRSQLRLRHILR